jgi:hypothetical protein
MLNKVYGQEVTSEARVFEWYKLFSEGKDKAEFDSRSGRPTTSISDENVEG